MAELEYGAVIGQYLIVGPGREERPVQGTVTFKAVEPDEITDEATLYTRESFEAVFNPEGWLVPKGGTGDQVVLPAGWWEVTFPRDTGLTIKAPVRFHVGAGEQVVLPQVQPLVPSPTVKFVVNEQVYTETLAARVAAEGARDVAVQAAEDATAPTEEVVDARIDAKRNTANGLAPLGPDSKVPLARIPVDAIASSEEVGAVVDEALEPALTDIDDLKTKTTTGYLAPAKVAPLVSGKLPEANVPDRLTEPALSATSAQVADARIAVGAPTANGLALRAALTSGLPTVISVQGDSTGNAPDEWVRLLTAALASSYPGLRVLHRLWSQTRLAYDSPDVIAAGTEAYHEPTAANMVHLNNTGALAALTGDFELHAKVRSTDIDAATRRIILAQWGSTAADQSFWWYIDGTNGLTLGWQETGGAFRSAAVASFAQLTAQFADNTDIHIGVRLDVDNGSGQYRVAALRSPDGLTGSWVEFGTPVTGTTGVSSVKVSTGYLKVGGRGTTAGNTDPFNGRIYSAEVCRGIGSAAATIARFEPGLATRLSSWTGVEGNPWVKTAAGTTLGSPLLLVLNASSPGEDAGYSVTNFAGQVAIEPALAILSYSYNGQSASQQPDYAGVVYAPLLDRWNTTYPRTPVMVTMQGPNIAPRSADQIIDHARRVRGVAQLAASRGKQIIDAFTALSANPSLYIDPADGVHPVPAGSLVWYQVVRQALRPAVTA